MAIKTDFDDDDKWHAKYVLQEVLKEVWRIDLSLTELDEGEDYMMVRLTPYAAAAYVNLMGAIRVLKDDLREWVCPSEEDDE